jgi:hypothetical protein
MRRVFGHPLFLSALTIGVLYAVFAHLLNPPLPRSLVIQYMVICVAGVLLVASFDDKTAKRFAEPVTALMGSPKLALARAVALICVVAGAGALTYSFVKPGITSPLELRTVHPAPPSTLQVYGETYDLLKLENPVRAENPKGSEGYDEAVAEGAELYYSNCLYCHGDRLDGQGHFGQAFNPRPANFQDVGTIAQLQESYLFWRITTPVLAHHHRRPRTAARRRALGLGHAGVARNAGGGRGLEDHHLPLRLYRPCAAVVGAGGEGGGCWRRAGAGSRRYG